MTMRARGCLVVAAGLVGIAGPLACGKSEDKKLQGAAEPAAAQENQKKAAALEAPSLFAHIPADTPYVFASFDPVPRPYLDRISKMMKSIFDQVAAEIAQNQGGTPVERFGAALFRDMRANFDEAGFKKIFGITPDARMALYGIGVVPVFRLELADGKALLASIERWQTESGLALPTASVEGRSYWRFAEDDVVLLAAVADNHLVFSAGPADMIDQALPFILGAKQPVPSMADGGPLKKVAEKYGFAGVGLGYVDSGNLLKLLAVANFFQGAGSSETVPPACMEELKGLATRFPRLVFGYDKIDVKRADWRMVLETEAALAARLQELAVEVPGLAAGLPAEGPLFSFGLGIDLDKARQLALDSIASMERIGAACEGDGSSSGLASARSAVSQPLPPGLDKVRGLFVSVLEADMTGGKFQKVDAYAVVAAEDPAALLAQMKQMAPMIGEVKADGQFHEALSPGVIPDVDFSVKSAIKPKALVFATGGPGQARAEAAFERKGTSPLFYIGYDLAKVLRNVQAMAPTALDPSQKMMVDFLGKTAMWAQPIDSGIALAFSMEFN